MSKSIDTLKLSILFAGCTKRLNIGDMPAEEFVEAMDKGLAAYTQASPEIRQGVIEVRNKAAEVINRPLI
jgi:hypothetical protein